MDGSKMKNTTEASSNQPFNFQGATSTSNVFEQKPPGASRDDSVYSLRHRCERKHCNIRSAEMQWANAYCIVCGIYICNTCAFNEQPTQTQTGAADRRQTAHYRSHKKFVTKNADEAQEDRIKRETVRLEKEEELRRNRSAFEKTIPPTEPQTTEPSVPASTTPQTNTQRPLDDIEQAPIGREHHRLPQTTSNTMDNRLKLQFHLIENALKLRRSDLNAKADNGFAIENSKILAAEAAFRQLCGFVDRCGAVVTISERERFLLENATANFVRRFKDLLSSTTSLTFTVPAGQVAQMRKHLAPMVEPPEVPQQPPGISPAARRTATTLTIPPPMISAPPPNFDYRPNFAELSPIAGDAPPLMPTAPECSSHHFAMSSEGFDTQVATKQHRPLYSPIIGSDAVDDGSSHYNDGVQPVNDDAADDDDALSTCSGGTEGFQNWDELHPDTPLPRPSADQDNEAASDSDIEFIEELQRHREDGGETEVGGEPGRIGEVAPEPEVQILYEKTLRALVKPESEQEHTSEMDELAKAGRAEVRSITIEKTVKKRKSEENPEEFTKVKKQKESTNFPPKDKTCLICDGYADEDRGPLWPCSNPACQHVFHQRCHIPHIKMNDGKKWRCVGCTLESLEDQDKPEHLQLCSIWQEIWINPKAVDFRNPVTRVLGTEEKKKYMGLLSQNRPNVNAQPICLSDVRERLRKKDNYGGRQQFVDDMNAIFKNAIATNKADSMIYKRAVELERRFTAKYISKFPSKQRNRKRNNIIRKLPNSCRKAL